jgi:DNA-binding XRE family transcriptional regulator
MTQDDLAIAAGFQSQSYNRWETGKSWPESDTVTALAKALNVPESRLFYDESIFTPQLAVKVLNNLVDRLDKN